MRNIIEKIPSSTGRFIAEISQDPYPESPRDWENLFAIHHKPNRYFDFNEGPEVTDAEKYYILPIYVYIHSGIAFSLGPFSCPWDSGQCGILYVSYDRLKREYSTDKITPEILEIAYKNAVAEIETLNQYFSGDVYQYTITDTTDGQPMDSCGGFFGLDYIRESIQDALKYLEKRYDNPVLFPEIYNTIL